MIGSTNFFMKSKNRKKKEHKLKVKAKKNDLFLREKTGNNIPRQSNEIL